MGDSNSNIKIDINAEVAGFNAAISDINTKLDRLAPSFDKHNRAAKQASSQMDTVEASANKLTSTLNKLAIKVAAVFVGWKVAELIKESALLAARYETLGVSMQVVGNNAGYTSAQMEAAAVGMQNMGISMIESRQQAMRLVQANINLADSSKLARIAQDAAVIGNMNSSQAFATMIHGIQTGQTDVLRTIGLNISMEQSYKEYAVTLGKSANALTQAEKMQAVLNAVMREGKGIAGIYEAAMGTAAKQINSLERYHENLKVVMGSTFTEALAAAVGAYTGELKGLSEAAQELKIKGDLQLFARGSAVAIAAMGDAVRDVSNTVIIAAGSIGIFTAATIRLGTLPGSETWKQLGQDMNNLREMQAEAMEGLLGDPHKLQNATIAMFDNIDAKAKSSADKRIAIAKDYVAEAQVIAAAYSGTQYQIPALRLLADSYGGDIAAEHGSRKEIGNGNDKKTKKQKPFDPEGDFWFAVDEVAMKNQQKRNEEYLKDLSKSEDETNKELQRSALEAQAIIFDIDPIAKVSAEWEKLTALKEQGLLTDEQIGKSYAKTFENIGKDGSDAFKSLENAVRGWGNQFTDEMTKMVRTGKMNFSSLADSIINDLIRMQVQKSITEPLLRGGTNFLGSLFGSFGGGGGGGIESGVNMAYPSANGNVFSGAGISAYSGSVVDKPTLFPFARGTGLMGEAGPEAILPLTRINGKLGVQAQGGGANVTVNVINAPAGAQVQQRPDGNGGMTLDVIIEQIEGGIARNVSRGTGSLNGALTQTFGLNRAPGAY